MARRASVLEGFQIGKETTPGTAVSAGKRIQQPILSPRPVVPVNTHRGAGGKYHLAKVVGKEHTEASFEGVAGYNELMFLLSAHLLTPSGPTSNVYTFKPSVYGGDSITTFTVEHGNSSRAERFAYGFVPDLQLRFTRNEVTVSGQFLGRALTETHTITSSPTAQAHVPLEPTKWKVELSSNADLSSPDQIDYCFEAQFVSRGKWAPVFAADPSQASFSDIVEREVDCTFELVMEHGSEAAALMAAMRSSSGRRYLILTCTSAIEAATGVPYSLVISAPVELVDNQRGDQDGVYGSTYTLRAVYDPDFDTSGGALKITLATASTL